MKTLTALLSLCMLTGIYSYGQSNSGTMNASINKTFSVEKNGTEFPYHVKVMEHRNYPIDLENKNKNMVNKDRENKAAQVVKLIAVDSNNDSNYEHYMVLKYYKTVTDSFKVVPTDKGFAVKVDDKTMEYFVDEGIYFINNKDQDFFMIEEFKEIG
ncbi:hypothetical protein [Flagellimonas zhangzhouensis]|uniref:Intein N-terminal splicing region n=1 Tax=Flagellimonas zhangzhouensis TaxID=1073328 RepID=A0A1H2U406_9FLAO|nr:hypothetical protein [Allomuricauda zhangzhouensis]SDQ20473.1 hypothetical protein SAMN05216294_0857 [Allomuricauda zhangzhouensis]SDW50886.1 hypothetical protein SAMN04487892_1437 [Allomuricauda zhangzhouensis]